MSIPSADAARIKNGVAFFLAVKSRINKFSSNGGQNGVKKCISDFLQMVRNNNLDGFWIHIDVDVLNDNIMPAVDSRQPDGLEYKEFNEILQLLLADTKATGLEITILDSEKKGQRHLKR